MCILQDCANPTTEGVWWRDDTQWCRYSASHQAVIRKSIADNVKQIDLGTITSAVHPKGARYVLDLKEMEQAAVSTGQKRPVMVVDPVSTQMVKRDEPSQPTTVPGRLVRTVLPLNLHYKDSNGNLQRYDPDIEKQLLECMASGSQRTLLVPDGRSGHYFFDLEAMEQRFVSQVVYGEPTFSDKAAVPIIAEVPWDAGAKMMAMIAAKAEKSMRRKVLVMVVERFKSSKNLDALLSEKAAPRQVVTTRISTYSTAFYEEFVDSLDIVMQRLPTDRMGDIIRSAGRQDCAGNCEDMPLRIAFRPAKHPNASKTKVNSNAFWFSMAAPVAAAHAVVYGAVHLKILAFLLIIPAFVSKERAHSISGSCSGYVEVERPEYGLPLAQVSVR